MSTPGTDSPAETSSPAQAAGSSTQLTAQQLGPYYAALEKVIPGYTSAITNAANQSQTSLTGNEESLYGQYAPLINQLGQQMGASNLQSNANSIGGVLNSPASSQVTSGIVQGQQALNPNYNSTNQGIGQSNSGINSLLANINPNQFTGSQLDQVSRGLAQSNQAGGNANLSGASPITSLNNAMTFGTGLQNMQTQYGNIANQAAGTLGQGVNTANNLNGGITSFGAITGQPTGTSSANLSTNPSTFLPSSSAGTSTAAGSTTSGNNLLNTNAGVFNNQTNAANTANQTQVNALNGIGANSQPCSCYIAMQALGGVMPTFMKQARDLAYNRRPKIAKGYVRMARWLVPLMIRFDVVHALVCELMMRPLLEHAGFMFGERDCRPHVAYYKFWFKLWSITGKE